MELRKERLDYMKLHHGHLPPSSLHLGNMPLEERLQLIEMDRLNLLHRKGRKRDRLWGFVDMIAADIPFLIRQLREAK